MDNPETAKKSESRDMYVLAFRIFGDFGVTIAFPAVIAALAGQWLDEKFGTGKRYLIILLVIAFALTALNIWYKSRHYGKEYKKFLKEHE